MELVAVEADEVHFQWVSEHFAKNNIVGDHIHRLRGAVAGHSGTIRFPKVENPDEDYGASTRAVHAGSNFVEVKAYTIEEVLSAFSGPVDLVHMDIQGAEYDAISPALSLLRQRVKSMMIGTHISLEMHKQLAETFRQHGWTEVLNFDRSGRVATEFGEIEFGDGFLLYDNPTLS